jgi:hypothetical protein
LGYDDVCERDFDLIISNIPGKAGDAVISSLLADAQCYLKPGGVVAIVVVTPLDPLVSSVLTQLDIEVLNRREFNGHVVYQYRFLSPPSVRVESSALQRDVYNRARVVLTVGNDDLHIKTAYGLPEFDSLDYLTDLLIKVLVSQGPASVKHAVVVNPGQGYLPAVLWQLYKPGNIVLVSRDLLSLRYAGDNLRINGCPAEHILNLHQVGWGWQGINSKLSLDNSETTGPNGFVDCVFGFLRSDEDSAISTDSVKQVVADIKIGGHLYLAGGSTPITRVLKGLNLDKRLLLKKRRKHQGRSVAIIQRRK